MTEAASHADPNDLASVRLFAEELARSGVSFTSEEVRARLSDSQNERLDAFPHSLGGVFFSMQREGTILRQGAVKAQRPEARGRWLTVWRGGMK